MSNSNLPFDIREVPLKFEFQDKINQAVHNRLVSLENFERRMEMDTPQSEPLGNRLHNIEHNLARLQELYSKIDLGSRPGLTDDEVEKASDELVGSLSEPRFCAPAVVYCAENMLTRTSELYEDRDGLRGMTADDSRLDQYIGMSEPSRRLVIAANTINGNPWLLEVVAASETVGLVWTGRTQFGRFEFLADTVALRTSPNPGAALIVDGRSFRFLMNTKSLMDKFPGLALVLVKKEIPCP